MCKRIHTGDVYISKDGVYLCIDTSWDRRGSSGSFTSGSIKVTGNAHYLSVLEVENFEVMDSPDIRGLKRAPSKVFPPLKCDTCEDLATHTLGEKLLCTDCAIAQDDWSARMRHSHSLSSTDLETVELLHDEAARCYPYCQKL
jgi:hypothetical protein